MKCFSTACLVAAVLAGPASAQPSFFDDFEPTVDHGVWKKWPEADEIPFSDCRPQYNHTDTPGATCSARAEEADPWGYAMYADFGATPGPAYAEVYIQDPLDDDGMDYDRPVSNMLALIGASDPPEGYTDYLQLGVIAWYDPEGMSDTYSIRTKHRDDLGPEIADYVDTGVPRKKDDWIKLGIAAESLASGGQVRFYIDDQLVYMSYRKAGVDLQFVRLGVNFKSYDYMWYDDVAVTDVLPPDDFSRFDVDDDGDVDQDDFGEFQACYSGSGTAHDGYACWRMDADDDLDVDVDDLTVFEACASGPAVPADPACDDALPPL